MPKGENNRKLTDEQRKEIVRIYTTPDKDGIWIGCNTIAKIFGVHPNCVNYHLHRAGIPIRDDTESHSHGKRCKPIVNLPVGVAPFCACGCSEIVAWNQRKNGWSVYVVGHYRKDAPYKSPDWLREQYVTLHRSADNIAKEFHVNATVVRKFMKKFGIQPRTTKETLILNGFARGANNPAWKGGIALWAYAPEWKRIAHDIRKRDDYTCQICHKQFAKSSKLLHVHHKDGDKFNNEPTNLVTVCATCHPKGKRKENGFI